MSFLERVLHAILFEVLAVVLSVAAIALFTEHSVSQSTLTVVLISLIAMGWNLVFNWGFDRLFTGKREARGLGVRVLHAVAFEGGLLVFTLPLIAYLMQMSWLEAFMMDIALTLMILVYTVIFNWVYDHLRLTFVRQHD